ncbi:MAG: prepilin-type N-terminal cleavage/methylation domain-containing protein [Holophagales bacterium]|nr:prepilin-type N-terminal cleavage/methylation domain-containing protein [Holophagales bacterium]MBK9963933.1 prepilin-type N-terminal cleavage/methylation domain-containing protein [Holophagales bacterium]
MKRHRGFTLIEALVSILILSVVMIVALTLLVSMRSFAAKQQAFTAPRQTARAGIDYLSFFLAGAADLNVEAGNPNALVMWTTYGDNNTSAGDVRQASYNNLSAAQAADGLGDEGTDIITISIPTTPVRIPIITWNPLAVSSGPMAVNFTAGCPDDVRNLALFKQVTGATTAGGTDVSGLLTVQDSVGRWRYLRITGYTSSTCTRSTGANPTLDVIDIQTIAGNANQLNPPGGWREDLIPPYTMNAGLDFTSFRVRNRNLEQKTSGVDAGGVYSPGVFDPNCDKEHAAGAGGCPTIGFTPVVENVEDLQVAYVYRDGTIWNTANRLLSAPPVSLPPVAATAGGIPGQVPSGTGAPLSTDITNVRALRISVIARSNPLDIGARGLSAAPPAAPVPGDIRREGIYRRPALEDHALGPLDTVATGVFDRYRLTTTLILRNRMLGF